MGFVVVLVLACAHVLTKSTYSTKIESLQLCLLWSAFSPQFRGVACLRYGLTSSIGVLPQMLDIGGLGLGP